MTTKRHGIIPTPGELRFERFFKNSVEKMWSYLTESEKRGKWLAKGEMELFEGGAVRLDFLHSELSPIPGLPPEMHKAMESGHGFTSRITRIDPPNLLAFTWHDNSEVTFELTEQESGVLLVLTHRKLDANKATSVSVATGWHTHLEILEANLAGATPQNFWVIFENFQKDYEAMF